MRSASPLRSASIPSITASEPLQLWLVMHALLPFSPYLMPMWPSTLLGSERSSHIGLTVLASSRPNSCRLPFAAASSGK